MGLELGRQSQPRFKNPLEAVSLLRDALVGSEADLSRQEYIFQIAVLVGIGQSCQEHPELELEVDDCLLVLDWLTENGLLSDSDRNRLIDWVETDRIYP
jgi:hypothetical protein